MSVVAGASARMDPQYEAGLFHLQAGEWSAAVQCFEELLEQHPDDTNLRAVLQEARYKSGLQPVRAKRWIIGWRAIIFRLLALLAIGGLVYVGVQVADRQLAPWIAQTQRVRYLNQLLLRGNAYSEAGDLDVAQASYQELLGAVPDPAPERELAYRQAAIEGLDRVAEERQALALYEEGVASQKAGDDARALASFTQLLLLRSDYRDVQHRIETIRDRQALDGLFADAEAAYQAWQAGSELEGGAQRALSLFEQIRALDVTYEDRAVLDGLVTLHLSLGRDLVMGDAPTSEALPRALDHFGEALTLQPRNQEAALEHQLASLCLEGLTRYDEGLWDPAIRPLREVFNQRSSYLDGRVAETLYDAYVRSGDQARGETDPGRAHEQYRLAAELPVADTALARQRMSLVAPYLTPTATPTVTPTPTSTPTQTPIPTPTPIATWTSVPPTPTPRPLLAFRNHIAFMSTDEDRPGYWVMDSNGENRTYLGNSRSIGQQYAALLDQYSYSPDGLYQVFVGRPQGARTAQIYVLQPPHPQYGELEPRQLTKLAALCYDPVWSPDGGRVAFVSQDAGSDDVWVINADGTNPRNLTRNTWEWDKHPSWSPDSRRIVFWSNRTGLKQIFVMDADGRNVRNISSSTWDEYDPLWIR